jgi:hypothetical protein
MRFSRCEARRPRLHSITPPSLPSKRAAARSSREGGVIVIQPAGEIVRTQTVGIIPDLKMIL